MTTIRDAQGILLVAFALLVGVALAVGAARSAPSPPPVLQPTTTATASDQPLLATGGGDRELGRVAFRSVCQECHTQGRQSFPPAARERPNLLATRIRNGAGEMPSFAADHLPDDTLQHILAYIGTPSEPEPTPTPEPRIRGVTFEILEAAGRPGERPTVRFRIRDDAGVAIAPREMAAFNLTVAGPTVAYRWAQREDARNAETLPDGTARYTFVEPLPVDAAGTFGVATEGYFLHAAGVAGPQPVRDTGFNVVSYFAVTDQAPVPPRPIVRVDTCNQCHGTLATHGGTRRNTEFCVMCHNVNQDDGVKRATIGGPMPPESVLFRSLIHHIHTGEDLSQPFSIIGGSPASPAPVDLTKVEPFPKDRANCVVCHDPNTFTITQALAQLPPMRSTVDGQIMREVPPITSACVGCHDTPRTVAHAASQTSGGVESCATCHGEGRPYSVTSVHRVVTEREPALDPANLAVLTHPSR